jgi:hypothetical protein
VVERKDATNKISNLGISLMRTAVPLAWGYVLTWAASAIPVLVPVLERPEVVGASSAITFALSLAWYGLMRWLEPRLPNWFVTLVLGWSTAPRYVTVTARPAAPVIPRQSDTR